MDDDVFVMTVVDAEGVPQRFRWRERVWAVSGRPVPWTKRLPWWGTAALSGRIDLVVQKIWRVVGVDSATGETVTIDLAVEEPGWCRLAGIVD